MAGTGMDYRTMEMPTARTGNMSTLRPSVAGVKRTGTDMNERMLGIASSALSKRFRERAAGGAGGVTGASSDSGVSQSMGALRGVLPAAMTQSMNVVNTGFSALDAQSNGQIVLTVLAQPYRYHRWEQSYSEFMPLFLNRDEAAERDHPGVYALGSVPLINSLLESAEAASGRGNVAVAGAAAQATSSFAAAYASMTALTAVEFERRWNWLGNFTQFAAGGIYSSDPTQRRASGTQRAIGYTRWQRSNVFNVFSTGARPGDKLYMCVRDTDVTRYENVLDPDGNTLARRSRPRARALQMQGMTDSDGGALYHAGSCTTAADFLDTPAGSPGCTPADGLDSDYVRRQHRAAQQYEIVEFGDLNDPDAMRVVPLAESLQALGMGERAAVQETLESVSQVVYDAYMEGAVYPVGMVRECKDAKPSESAIARGLRSHEAMKQTGVLEIYGK